MQDVFFYPFLTQKNLFIFHLYKSSNRYQLMFKEKKIAYDY